MPEINERNLKINTSFKLIKPSVVPPLDEDFRPAVLANQAFLDEIADQNVGVPLLLGLERSDGYLSHFATSVYPEGHTRADANLHYIERIVKFLLWQKGGWKIYVGGPRSIGKYIEECYSAVGLRQFDHQFMGRDVYKRPFTVVSCDPGEVPAELESGEPLGGHLDGCRIGFDLGASDRKVTAVINGEVVFSEETDPDYHYGEVMKALKAAAARMPRLGAIGGSAAGVYIDNRVRIASLFRGIPAERYHEVRNLFIRIQDEMGVPLVIVNDGDVTALAGSMSLEDNGVLGIAMGSGQAGGYVDLEGNITGWLNELGLAPLDYNPHAPADEWSGDRGVGSLYFSQQCVFRLAPKVGINVPGDHSKAAQLQYVQELLEAGHEGAVKIWQTIGCYLGYGIAHYADFYELKHVIILGRITSGVGGEYIIDGVQEVLGEDFPELAGRVNIQLPDEKSRRIGQAIAAASLPKIN
jgi:predicted NBD/HSP70 family sugar kinase